MKSSASGGSTLTRSLLICLLLVLLVFSTACTVVALSRSGASRITLVKPGVAAIQVGPIETEADPHLAEDGYRCTYLSRSDTVNQIAFVRREVHTARIQISGTKRPPKQCEFSYVLFDQDGKRLSEGRLIPISLDNENGVFEIADADLAQTKRIVVDKK
jgi:hypothetical protein